MFGTESGAREGGGIRSSNGDRDKDKDKDKGGGKGRGVERRGDRTRGRNMEGFKKGLRERAGPG